MLVLSRKIGETVVIAGNIEVKVISVDRNKVRIGVECPRDITVLRQELIEQRRQDRTGE